uniref:Uncharacterized protein n=1 Tax=Setaria viridis TaxID=4556 RepID=A0A4V6D4K1_SETVI|nr:hypothetical protein SEVIR_9G295100v2 [Setaria viridis]
MLYPSVRKKTLNDTIHDEPLARLPPLPLSGDTTFPSARAARTDCCCAGRSLLAAPSRTPQMEDRELIDGKNLYSSVLLHT